MFVLKPLSVQELQTLLHHALTDEKRGLCAARRNERGMAEMIAAFANGDARVALNTLEMVVLNGRKEGIPFRFQEMVEQS